MDNESLWETQKSISYIIDKVANRGWEDKEIEVDRFAELRQDQRFQNAQIAQLYEEYFLPDRHEYEWQILSDIVDFIVTSPAIEFALISIAGGVLGNTAYDLLKSLCSYVADQYKENFDEKARKRESSFRQIAADVEKIQSFFREKPKARILEIEEGTGLPREKIYPIIKIVGLNHYRRGDKSCYWETP
jgi:hypothetical protein